MTISLKHKFQSGVADSTAPSDNTKIKPSHWNSEHELTLSQPGYLIGRTTPGPGPAEDIPIADFATAAQGALADTAVQPDDLAAVATSGSYDDLTDKPTSIGRELLTADRTYYVRTDGSDSNNGLTNTAGGAFLTIQKAVDVVASLDLSIFNAIIQCGPGTRTSPIILKRTIGSGMPILLGDTTTPANCTIDVTSAQCITLDTAAVWTMRGFKLQTTTGGWCVDIPQPGCHLIIDGNMEYGATPLFHFVIAVGGTLSIKAAYTISGSCYTHFFVQAGGTLFYTPGAVTLTGTPAWTNTFINVTSGGIVSAGSVTFTGAATGKRYDVSLNGVINTFGGGANFFPGNSAGTAATGGQYA